MSEDSEHSAWLCHVCDYKSQGGQSVACSVCFKTTCSTHLQHVPVFNEETGLYEIRPVCVLCAAQGLSN